MDLSPSSEEPVVSWTEGFKSLVDPAKKAPVAVPLFLKSSIIKNSFRLHTICLFGAIAQMGLSFLLPRPWNLVPALALGLHSTLKTLVQSLLSRNAFISDSITGRATAQFPINSTGHYGVLPTSQPLVVFHFGVRFNHPLGVLAPGAQEITHHFRAMVAALNKDREDSDASGQPSRFGLLGASSFHGNERASHATLLYVLYFRDLDGLRRFAHDPAHVGGWHFLRDSGCRHISAFHETFCVPAGNYETIYVNSAPLLLGAAAVPCPAEDEVDEDDEGGNDGKEERIVWKSPLVDANTPLLASMAARLRDSA